MEKNTSHAEVIAIQPSRVTVRTVQLERGFHLLRARAAADDAQTSHQLSEVHSVVVIGVKQLEQVSDHNTVQALICAERETRKREEKGAQQEHQTHKSICVNIKSLSSERKIAKPQFNSGTLAHCEPVDSVLKRRKAELKPARERHPASSMNFAKCLARVAKS